MKIQVSVDGSGDSHIEAQALKLMETVLLKAIRPKDFVQAISHADQWEQTEFG